MLRTRLIHPPLLAALAGAGHGSRILLADSNYAHDVNVRPGATVIHLNIRPGMVTVDEILSLIIEFVPLESVSTMRPDDGSTPQVWSRYAELLGPDLALNPVGRHDFYAAARSPDLSVAVATGDERLYANLLLTVGYIPPRAN
ncbi:RbsD/FucU family protein [Catellatospora sp. KI3]|uniref:RbsD/FucU family protein n=1 Tax=Catellatospora sp. KI3 TaxID=3041620 RepID=UPI0024829A58|nr:RbsD/FucU family protein [Catellatospora sp. KI3]MDI1460967.1 RbsD/FucU family protein [Catellatospora sp. KI3]